MEAIMNSMQELTQRLNNFNPGSEQDLGRVRGEMTTKVAGKLSETEVKVAKLTKELFKQTKATEDDSTGL